MNILVNQVGYAPAAADGTGGCTAILQLRDGEDPPDCIELRNSDGLLVLSIPAGTRAVVPGWRGRSFFVLRFSAGVGDGYRLEAERGPVRAVSAPFRVEWSIEAFQLIPNLLFGFAAFRSSGSSDMADRTLPFHGGRTGTVDAHGGWYDASGDTSKYLSHLSYANFMNPQQTPLVVWTLLDALARLETSDFPLGNRLTLRFREEAAWGADFLMRMQDADGYFYTTVFDQWSKDTSRRRICSYSTQKGILSDRYRAGYRQGGGMAIAALARAAAEFGRAGIHGGRFCADEYLDAAMKGWRHLEVHNLEYQDDGRENIIDDTCALLAATELLAAGAPDRDQLQSAAEERCRLLLGRWNDDGGWFRADGEGRWSWFHASDEGLPLVVLLRARETGVPGPGTMDDILEIADRALEAELMRAGRIPNPFRHPRRIIRMPGRESGEAFFYPHENPSGYWWQGENARLASWAAAFRRRWMDMPRPGGGEPSGDGDLRRRADALDFADAQVSWILGCNPFDMCMLQGRGVNNPDYEWDHFNVPGGVANGITSGFTDEQDIAFKPAEALCGGNHSWRWGEQWLPHAAWLLLAAAWSVPMAGGGSVRR